MYEGFLHCLAPPFYPLRFQSFSCSPKKIFQLYMLDFNFCKVLFFHLFHLVHSLYLASFSLGMMFIDCSSWNKSLQA